MHRMKQGKHELVPIVVAFLAATSAGVITHFGEGIASNWSTTSSQDFTRTTFPGSSFSLDRLYGVSISITLSQLTDNLLAFMGLSSIKIRNRPLSASEKRLCAGSASRSTLNAS